MDAQYDCITCNDTCSACIETQCNTCVHNREYISGSSTDDTYCDCPTDSVNHYPTSLYCSTCTVAVVTAKFDNDLRGITITFPYAIAISNSSIQGSISSYSTTNCQVLFSTATLTVFGSLP